MLGAILSIVLPASVGWTILHAGFRWRRLKQQEALRAQLAKIMNNLLISYDLNTPGQNYAKVIEAIKSLGTWAHVHKSFWYVKSSYGAEYARNEIWKAMDESDTVYVVDATNNRVPGSS
jgi:hypothetical protein